MSGLLLRLAGPLQSWGERSTFGTRDSAAFPTRSALIGMFAAAEGRDRHQDPSVYAELSLTIRVDRPGVRLVDFHTVGGGLEPALTAATATGGHKKAAVISRRHYLSDAVFTVAVTGRDELTNRIAAALDRPQWAPYLGRRSCIPDEPFVLRRSVDDPVEELRAKAPLSLEPPAASAPTVGVEFWWDRQPPDLPLHATVVDIMDVPESFAPTGARYSMRRLYRTVEALPARLCAGGEGLHQRLFDYATGVHV